MKTEPLEILPDSEGTAPLTGNYVQICWIDRFRLFYNFS